MCVCVCVWEGAGAAFTVFSGIFTVNVSNGKGLEVTRLFLDYSEPTRCLYLFRFSKNLQKQVF